MGDGLKSLRSHPFQYLVQRVYTLNFSPLLPIYNSFQTYITSQLIISSSQIHISVLVLMFQSVRRCNLLSVIRISYQSAAYLDAGSKCSS